MDKVLITGGTGLVGRHLSQKLRQKGYEVALLSRTKNSKALIPVYEWDYEAGKIEAEALEFADIVIHLAGANIAEKRWTSKRKQEIVESRVRSATFIFETLSKKGKKPKLFVTASAVGYYGALTAEKLFAEADAPFDDFVGITCQKWEQVADKFQLAGVRTVKIRTGIVFAQEKGALEKMIAPLKIGVGVLIGSGEQYLPWIHIEDLCELYIKAIEDSSMQGAFNAVAPEHLTYRGLVEEFGSMVRKPFLTFKIPAFLMKWIFGEMSEILLNGSRVSSEKLVKQGYSFKYPTVRLALKALFSSKE